MFRNVLSRRLCEVLGVAFFGLALLWVISLASYSAADPALFFTSPATGAPQNFGGRFGAFVAEQTGHVGADVTGALHDDPATRQRPVVEMLGDRAHRVQHADRRDR